MVYNGGSRQPAKICHWKVSLAFSFIPDSSNSGGDTIWALLPDRRGRERAAFATAALDKMRAFRSASAKLRARNVKRKGEGSRGIP